MRYLVRLLLRLLALFPLRVHYALGAFVSWLCEKVFRYRVGDVTVNLARSFPEKKYEDIKVLRHKFYRHFGDVVAETVWFGGSSGRRLRRQHLVELENPEELNRLYDIAPSVMVLMSHAGNWELIGGMASYDYSGLPSKVTEDSFVVVYRQQSSRMWDWIMKRNRTAPLLDRKGFGGYLESKSAVRFVYENRDKKLFYNFITDQYPYFDAPDYLKVRFMNQDTVTMKGAAELARKFGMAVSFMSMRQEGRGLYKVNYKTICEDASAMDAGEIMKTYYSMLQADLEAQPWNYLWTHRRWK